MLDKVNGSKSLSDLYLRPSSSSHPLVGSMTAAPAPTIGPPFSSRGRRAAIAALRRGTGALFFTAAASGEACCYGRQESLKLEPIAPLFCGQKKRAIGASAAGDCEAAQQRTIPPVHGTELHL